MFKLLCVLRVNLAALAHHFAQALLGRHGRKFKRIGAKGIGAQQHTFAGLAIAGRWVADFGNGQVGVGDAAVDVVVLLPELALELQARLERPAVGNSLNGVVHGSAHINVDLAQNGQWNGAQAPICLCDVRRGVRAFGVHVSDRDAVGMLVNLGDLGIELHTVFDLPVQRQGNLVHAAHWLEDGGVVFEVLVFCDAFPQVRAQQFVWLQRR